MHQDEKRKGMLDLSAKKWIVIKGIASITLGYFAVQLFIGAITNGSISKEGPYILWGCASLFTAGALAGLYRFIRDAGVIIRAKKAPVENAKKD